MKFKAMILAAGRGKRLRPLTDEMPKPLVRVLGKPLIVYHLESLAKAGIEEIVINLSWHGEKIREVVGTGEKYGVHIHYSMEPEEGGLETGGGIFRALSFLGKGPFIVVNGDIWTDYPFANLFKPLDNLAHLVLVSNPPRHPAGDFSLQNNQVTLAAEQTLTFSGIAVYRSEIFANCVGGSFSVVPLLKNAITQQQVSGERYNGQWYDVGTLESLTQLNSSLCLTRTED
jgi:MurNAc alpha-1-phosphate uridylyltransferase